MTPNTPDTSGIKFGPFWITPGISKANFLVMLVVGGCVVMMSAFPGLIQPLLFANMGIPEDEQGILTANLSVLNDVIALSIMTVVGALSDRTGRRIIIVCGFLILGTGLAIFPHATGLTQLYLFKGIIGFGMGITSTTMLAIVQDYPQNVSRGKVTGISSVFSAFGVLFASMVLLQFPEYFRSQGLDGDTALIFTFMIAAGIGGIAMVIAWFGLYKGLPDPEHRTKSVFDGIDTAIKASRKNPRLMLSYLAAFTTRGDFAVINMYFSLWFMTAGLAQGLPAEEVVAKAGMYFGVLNISVLIWAPIFGFIIDKFNRVSAVCFGLTIAGLGYTAMGMVDNPLDPMAIIPACIILGMGESSAIVSCGSLVGQESPPKIRGSVVGFYSLCGTFGIMVLTYTSGILFDTFSPSAPFLFMGVVNILVVLIALWVRFRFGTINYNDLPDPETVK